MQHSNGIAYIPVVLMVVSVAAFAWMAYATWQYSQLDTEVQPVNASQPATNRQAANTNTSATNTSTTNTNAVANTNTAASTADWKTYENAQYHFSFKYPSDWKLTDSKYDPNADDLFSSDFVWAKDPTNDDISFMVCPDERGTNCAPYQDAEWTSTTKTVTVGGKAGVETLWAVKAGQNCPACTPRSTITLSERPTDWKTGRDFLLRAGKDNSPIPAQILSTFTFDETLGWKTYENKELGFRFKYPDWFDNFILQKTKMEEPTGSGFVLASSFENLHAGEIKPFMLGGITADFSAATEGQFIWTQGYRKTGSDYYYIYKRTTPDAGIKITVPVQEIAATNTTVLLLEGVADTALPGYPPVFDPTKGYWGALVNLPGSTFPGIGLKLFPTEMTKEQFVTMLGTFTILE